jgi:hypothetical protein
MMDDEGNGDKKVVPMLLKNIQFKVSQPQTTAEAAKRLEEAFRRGAATNGGSNPNEAQCPMMFRCSHPAQ